MLTKITDLPSLNYSDGNATIEFCHVRHVVHKHELHELHELTMTRTLSKASGLI